ncbi:hypothetical protein IP91_02408 [Pseudoduganella lurida]|uniref:Flagellar Assembly Protein A N-terminal region domain-containing protein n=1 Tax=Pseudoduganella lurida TaxID=1036180 RepID=A0A562RC02_9BURK|nr:flagellar assembly protein A [Pseudoduganella lurida]TWI66589.1 hypothetical protein IP91_02408 [Pseudoduganella lurida]
MPDELADDNAGPQAAGDSAGDGPLPAIVEQSGGVWLRAGLTPAAGQAAAGQVFLSGSCFAGLDYAIFLRMLFGAGPELPPALQEAPLVRFADAVVPFPPARRALYRIVKVVGGEADYFFEPVFIDNGEGAPEPATLRFDEFVADMWIKGIRFGIDAAAVHEAIASGKPSRRVVARRLAPVPGNDAAIVEVSASLHRSNAPLERADGRFDLHTFQNRFPQVPARVRLLRKEPATPGTKGFELSGIPILPPPPKDLELTRVAGPGTVIEHLDGHDYLVSAVEGFINVDSKSHRISIGPKIVSREGVSVRTTGNLQLAGEYEEFGDVQENRIVEGAGITIHGDVYGNIGSRGGSVVLKRNLMGGSAVNADGPIRIGGTAANAVVQTKQGDVTIRQAQNCVITGSKVMIGEATNCEIIADDVVIRMASGCAVAARHIAIDSAGPRKQSEMLLFALVPDTARFDAAIADFTARAGHAARSAEAHKAGIDAITSRPDVHGYLELATRVRKRELTLTPEQLPRFQKMAVQVGPALKEVARLSLAGKEAQVQQAHMLEQAENARRQRHAIAGTATCKVRLVDGETTLRTMVFHPEAGPPHQLAPKEVRARLRGRSWTHAPVLQTAHGAVDWTSDI